MTSCPVTNFFQWAADFGRIHVERTATTQQITVRLPDYDSPEDPEEDYEVVFPPTDFSFEVPPADDHGRVTIQLLLTDEIVAEIPLVHLPADFKFGQGSMVITITIPREQVTLKMSKPISFGTKKKNALQTLFQWAADEGRARLYRQLKDSAVVEQEVCLILPWRYDDSAVPDWDHDQMFEFEGVHAEFTTPDVVTMTLIITPEIAKQISHSHLPADFKFGRGRMPITITIPREQVTDIGF